jgi:hypothetical protein
MSVLKTVETDLGKVGHAFVIGAEKLNAAIVGAETALKKAAPEVATVESIVNIVVDDIYPGAGVVARAIETAAAKAFDAVDALGDATTADGLNIQLDQAAVEAIKAALPTVKAQAQTTPGS